MENSLRPICILIHGTFAANAKWIDPQSGLSGVLRSNAQAETLPFRWSGANNPRARRVAGLELNKEIVRLRDQDPDRPIFLIAHSHGGNVIRHAVNDDVSGNVSGCFFFGTPFTNYYPRNLRVFRKIMRICFAVIGILLLVRLISIIAMADELDMFKQKLHKGTSTLALTATILLTMISLFAAAVLATFLGVARRKQRSLRRRAFTESAPRQHDYVFYTPSDEAKRLLTLVDRLSSIFFAMLRGLQSTVVTALRHNKWAFRITLCLVPVLTLFGLFDEPIKFYPIYAFVPSVLAVGFLTLTMITATLIMPVIIFSGWILSLILRSSFLTYGWEGFVTFALFDIVASRVPLRRESIALTMIECSFPTRQRGLSHSRFYDSVDIGAFVVSRINGTELAFPNLRIVKPDAKPRRRLPRSLSLYIIPAYLFGIVSVVVGFTIVISLVRLQSTFIALSSQ